MKSAVPPPKQVILISALMVAIVTGLANAQFDNPLNLTEGTRTAVVGDVSSFAISPDGSRVVYLADGDTVNVFELYSAPVGAGGGEIKLNGPRPPGGGVTGFEISPDGSRVVYLAEDTDGVFELYSAPVGAAGEEIKLNGPLPPGGSVIGVEISPDGSRVVYLADGDTDNVTELYSAPVGAAGGEIKLNGPLPPNGNVVYFAISLDGSRVVYRADGDTDGVFELYSTPAGAAGEEIKLNGPLPPNGDVQSDFAISPDGNRVVYRADGDSDNVFELYSAPAGAAGGEIKLNGPLPPNGNVQPDFAISADGSRVVYWADGDTDNVFELYSALAGAAGGEIKLNGPLPPNGDVQSDFAISPDGSRVVYRADGDTDNVFELYSAPVGAAGGEIKLNGPLPAGGDVQSDFTISPDGSRVMYLADGDTDNVFELYSAPVGAAGGEIKLNGLTPGGGVTGFEISPDGSRVVYLADGDTDNVHELYSVSLQGGPVVKLNGPLPPGGDVQPDFAISPDGSRVAYRADGDTDQVAELYSAPVGAAGGEIKLNGPLALGGGTISVRTTPDGNRLVFMADIEEQYMQELYSVSLQGGPVVKLNGPLPPNGEVSSGFAISPDGSRVLYRADGDTDNVTELYSAPVGAAGGEIKLNGPLTPNGDVTGFAISPDGSRVVYRTDGDTDNVFELYSAPIGAAGGELKLNAPLPPNGDVSSFDISPDGSRVVYLADGDTDRRVEIYSAPVGAAGAEIKLNGPLHPNGDVQSDFAISPDGSRVVYRAAGDTDGVVELYSAPVGVAGGEIKLNGPLPPYGDVSSGFVISPDGSRVVYLLNRAPIGVFELYSAPVGAAGGEIKLNGPLPAGGDVASSGFEISPDGSRVVYRADGDTDNVYELYSAPVGAAGGEIKLNGPLPPNGGILGGDVSSPGFAISSDGSRVVYQADGDTDNVTELYSAPVGLAGGEIKLNGPLPAGGDVLTSKFAISPDGSRVVYLADGDTDNVTELYRAPIGSAGGEIKLNGPLGFNGDVLSSGFVIASDNANRVAFIADQDFDEVNDLFVWRAQQAVWRSADGDWFTNANWEDGIIPAHDVEAIIALPATVHLNPTPTPAEAAALWLGGGGPSTLELRGGAVLSLSRGARLYAGGVLSGDGVVRSGQTLHVDPGAEIRAGTGEHLVLASGPVNNGGRIEAIGTASSQAQIDFDGAVINQAGNGVVQGLDALIRFAQGLENHGEVSFGGDINHLFGDLDNRPGGVVTVSGGAVATFNDDVNNNAVINVSAAGTLQSSAVFSGALSGNGVSGGGHVFIEGDARPGFSPGTMAFGGDVSAGPVSVFFFELGGTIPGVDYDEITVAGHFELGGAVTVNLVNGFSPSAGMTFDLWDAASVSNEFTGVNLPELPTGLYWHEGDVGTTGELRVGLTPETYAQFASEHGLSTPPGGDEEGDGRLNAFEYMVGGDPNVVDATRNLFALEPIGQTIELTFMVTKPVGRDLVVELETSTSLTDGPGEWSVLVSRTGNGAWTGSAISAPAGLGLEEVTVSDFTSGEVWRFYRLSVRLLP